MCTKERGSIMPKINDKDKCHTKSLLELIQKVAQSKSVSLVFTEFIEMSAITIANSSSLFHDDI